MNRKTTLVIATLLIATFIGTVIATVYFTRPIGNHGSIHGYNVEVWKMKPDYSTPDQQITTIEWGEFGPEGGLKTSNILGFPCLKLKNPANSPEYIAWSIDPSNPLPEGFTFSVKYCNYGDLTSGYHWQDLGHDDFTLIYILPGQFSSAPGYAADPNVGRIEFDLTVPASAPAGDFNFNILLKASDTQ